ncbi:uncharacterized protein BO97DRAFT_161276 [Aspergillus homomorphus CBS 101889]|uniref:Uncharacterized protein n=1 Tax=Aspergillus homomorphus (strain CBS 101889) TaxID=1450537 RepID=A0A395HRX4_ASPHC|nr:hypothetical protein BO97DRAFT_161276 [Aspergillus homomorphus CBS 101889]RAL09608.1 hypothetical protein BO97DRAFT_161276 [Aspergillus homomorphus CBS 101889]
MSFGAVAPWVSLVAGGAGSPVGAHQRWMICLAILIMSSLTILLKTGDAWLHWGNPIPINRGFNRGSDSSNGSDGLSSLNLHAGHGIQAQFKIKK